MATAGEGEFDVLPIPGTTTIDESGNTVVEIDVKAARPTPLTKQPAKNTSLYGAHGAVWSDAGLARLFGGAVLDSKISTPSFGDVIIGDSVVTSFRADNLIAHPSKVCSRGRLRWCYS